MLTFDTFPIAVLVILCSKGRCLVARRASVMLQCRQRKEVSRQRNFDECSLLAGGDLSGGAIDCEGITL